MRRPRKTRRRSAPTAVLRERLRQAQETLRAIQQDEVDALIVETGEGSRVALLEGSGHPYAALIEHINEGALTLSDDGRILYCNGFLARLLRDSRPVVGSPFRDLVMPECRAAFDSLFALGIAGGGHGELTLRSEDGVLHQVELSLFPLAPMLERGKVREPGRIGAIGIVTNLDALKASEHQLETRVRQQVAIAQLGDRALAGVSVDAILDEAALLVARALGATRCAIAELLPGGERMRIRAATGTPADHSGGMGSALSVVIPGEDAPFGVLEAESPGPGAFSRDCIPFLQAVGNILAAAIIRKRSEDLRRTLLEELITSRDGERRRLSRELHDETGQALWALVVGLDALESAAGPAEVRDGVQRLHAIAARTLDEVGRLARGLHPGALDDLGLVAAASQYLREFTSSYGIPVEQEIGDFGGERLSPPLEITLYRALQEALTNVARHARARSVRVTLRREAAIAELAVADDGVGFALEPARSPMKPGGLGLHGMRERTSLLGGELTVVSRPGAGTTVTVRIPLHAAAKQ